MSFDLDVTIGPARADLPPEPIAELIWSTDPALMDFMFRELSVFEKVVKREWPLKEGLICHKQAIVAVSADEFVGLCIGHTNEEYGPNFEAAQRVQTAALNAAEGQHLREALNWMDRLFPEPRASSFYILELAVSEAARGQGLGRRLISGSVERARSKGCERLALDVAADNPAVGLYRHLGLEIEIETRVPFLADGFEIGTHVHMSAALEKLDLPQK